MLVEPVDDDPIRQFTAAEERKLTQNLARLIRAIRFEDSKSKNYSIDLISFWHSQLFNEVREHAGRFRSRDYGEDILNFGPYRSVSRINVLDELEQHISEAHKLFTQLNALEATLQPSDFIKQVIKAALYLHAIFIRIHPFRDGNGCIGRLIMTFTLSRYNIPPLAIEVPRQEYIDCLNNFYASKNTDLDPLYNLALRIYINQI